MQVSSILNIIFELLEIVDENNRYAIEYLVMAQKGSFFKAIDLYIGRYDEFHFEFIFNIAVLTNKITAALKDDSRLDSILREGV